MFGDIEYLKKASAMAQHAAKRHATIAENLANADTPGYKARDLPMFDASAAVQSGDAHGSGLKHMMSPIELENAQASPNGNTVSVEDQLGRAADAQAQHETALLLYRKAMDFLRISIKPPR